MKEQMIDVKSILIPTLLSAMIEVFKGNPVKDGNCPATVKGAKA